MTTVEARLENARLADDGRPREPRRRMSRDAERDAIEKILERIELREKALQPLWDRMDADMERYALVPFEPVAGDGISPEDAYTSNEPRTHADKVISIVGYAPAIVKIESEVEEGQANNVDQDAERVAIGMLRLGDENLVKVGTTPFQPTLSHFAIVEGGWVACRNLLTKRQDGSTKVNLTPIDPRQLVFQMGSEGLIWAAIITMRNRLAIEDEYDFKFDKTSEDANNDDMQEKVVDYYRKEKGRWMNSVIIPSEHKYAKKPANTFSVEDPITIRGIGSNPGTASFSLTMGVNESRKIQGLEGFGESVFAANRAVYESDNRVKSILTSNLAKQNSGIYKTTSAGGEFTLEEEPDKAGQITLNSSLGEDVSLLDLPAIQNGAITNLGFINTDLISGGTPPSASGIASGSQSGRALTILNSVLGDRARPFAHAVEACMQGAVKALMAQYETGQYETLRVTGKLLDNVGFSREITPQEIQGHGPLTVELVPSLPQDDQAQWMMAEFARRPNAEGRPVVSDTFIKEDILRLKDAQLEERRVDLQLATAATPENLLMGQLQSALEAGNMIVVQNLAEQVQRLKAQQFMEDQARQFAFIQMMSQNPVQGAAQGMGAPAGGMGGPMGVPMGSPPSPTNGMTPEQMPLAGTPLGPSPGANDPTANAGVPRPNAQGIPGLELG